MFQHRKCITNGWINSLRHLKIQTSWFKDKKSNYKMEALTEEGAKNYIEHVIGEKRANI